MFHSILCATDFSPGGSHAVALAARWAEAQKATLDVLHVVTPVVSMIPETSFLAELRAMIRSDAAGKLDALVASLAPKVTARARLVDGFADHEIVAQADALGSDLVVVGTAGVRSFSRRLMGSTADRVVHTANVPVLAVPREAPLALPSAVVVPIDLAPASAKALAAARQLAADFGASTAAVIGYELPLFADRESEIVRDIPRTLAAKLREVYGLETGASVHTLESEPSAAIARVVQSTGANLVVMAGGGRSQSSALLLGSVTERVLRTSHVPVLVLRERAPA